MYQAKQDGQDSFQFFTCSMDTQVWRRLELTTALRQAVENGEFVLHYQPQVDVADGHVVGRWVIAAACAQIKDWTERGNWVSV